MPQAVVILRVVIVVVVVVVVVVVAVLLDWVNNRIQEDGAPTARIGWSANRSGRVSFLIGPRAKQRWVQIRLNRKCHLITYAQRDTRTHTIAIRATVETPEPTSICRSSSVMTAIRTAVIISNDATSGSEEEEHTQKKTTKLTPTSRIQSYGKCHQHWLGLARTQLLSNIVVSPEHGPFILAKHHLIAGVAKLHPPGEKGLAEARVCEGQPTTFFNSPAGTCIAPPPTACGPLRCPISLKLLNALQNRHRIPYSKVAKEDE
uniref:Uncharacterized protein n=1 Tax=Anopheles atroparvus TaxID=41427 RepID=A0A182J5B0_ANOAO